MEKKCIAKWAWSRAPCILYCIIISRVIFFFFYLFRPSPYVRQRVLYYGSIEGRCPRSCCSNNKKEKKRVKLDLVLSSPLILLATIYDDRGLEPKNTRVLTKSPLCRRRKQTEIRLKYKEKCRYAHLNEL